MPLPLPDLDTRRWADLVEEARALIPRFAPSWTDHNVHDPGIMLFELLAAITEEDVYRANRVPARHRRKFLQLLGYPPEAPKAAETYLTFRLEPAAAPLAFPAATLLKSDGELPWRTTDSLTVCPLGLLVLQSFDGATYNDLTVNLRDGVPVLPWGRNPAPDLPACYLGLDRTPPTGVPVSLWLQADASFGERDRIAEKCRAEHHSTAIVWEFWDGTDWQEIEPDVDETRGLTLPGAVVLTFPEAIAQRKLGASDLAAYYLRFRLAGGLPDKAPRLLDIAVNAVGVQQIETKPDVQVGLGSGAPWQEFRLPESLVASGVVTVSTAEGSVVRQWRQRPDLDASTRTDRDFTVDATKAVIRFGDGERGVAVPLFANVFAGYVRCSGAAGNVAAGRTWSLAGPPPGPGLIGITNRSAAIGGTAEETLEHAAGRAAETLWAHERVGELRSPDGTLDQQSKVEVLARKQPERATTVPDFERLALEVPGTAVARARAWANLDANYPGLDAPGTVSVVVVPSLPVGEPKPSKGLLRMVRSYLDARRVICTRLVVTGPTYERITVVARLATKPDATSARVVAEVVAALNTFLDPIGGGPDGCGWPFGRDVYRTEILRVIATTTGVEFVRDLELRANDQLASCGNLCVPTMSLVSPGQHVITTEAIR